MGWRGGGVGGVARGVGGCGRGFRFRWVGCVGGAVGGGESWVVKDAGTLSRSSSSALLPTFFGEGSPTKK